MNAVLLCILNRVFFRIKDNAKLHKNIFLKNEIACVCTNVRKYIMSQAPIVWNNTFILLYSQKCYEPWDGSNF